MTLCNLIIPISNNHLVGISLLAIAASLRLFSLGLKLLRCRQSIVTAPRSEICKASLGPAELNGIATSPYTLHAPITGQLCYYYRAIALVRSKKKSTWEKAAEETLHVPFFLDDKTGQLRIDPNGAELELPTGFCQEYPESNPLSIPEQVSSFLHRNGVPVDAHIRVEEYCIKPKDHLFIVGTVAERVADELTSPLRPVTVPQNDADKPGTHPEVIYLSEESRPSSSVQMSQQQKVAAALLKAGIARPIAWDGADTTASSTAVEAPPQTEFSALNNQTGEKQSADHDSVEPESGCNTSLILMKDKHDKALVISHRSQRALSMSLLWKSAVTLTASPILFLTGVYLLLAGLEVL